MFTRNMLRRLFLGLVFVVATSLTGCGMPTYSSSSSGFVEYGGQQPIVSGNTQYFPVQDDGYVRLPNGHYVRVQPDAQYPAQSRPQIALVPENGTTSNRVQYHHETQESSLVDTSIAVDRFSGAFLNGTHALERLVDVFSPYKHDKGHRHPPRHW